MIIKGIHIQIIIFYFQVKNLAAKSQNYDELEKVHANTKKTLEETKGKVGKLQESLKMVNFLSHYKLI